MKPEKFGRAAAAVLAVAAGFSGCSGSAPSADVPIINTGEDQRAQTDPQVGPEGGADPTGPVRPSTNGNRNVPGSDLGQESDPGQGVDPSQGTGSTDTQTPGIQPTTEPAYIDPELYDVPANATTQQLAAMAAGTELHHWLLGHLADPAAATDIPDYLVNLAETIGLPNGDALKYIGIKLDEKAEDGPYRGRWVELCEFVTDLADHALEQYEAGQISDDVWNDPKLHTNWLAQTIEEVYGLSPQAAQALAELDYLEVFYPASAGYCYQHASVLVFW